jgi:WD40 repeat protein
VAGIFISYSRRDKAFVGRLTAALTAAGRDFWLDEQDIPATADWLREIADNIAQADAVVFVLSPDSVAPTSTCRQEIELALRDQKRIVPLVCREVSAHDVVEPVRAINWLFFRQGDDFDAAFAKLLDTLDTDLDYWHEAARYLVRARQWEGRGENAGYALRGRELAEAERWLAEGATKRPTPTALHVRYITASRRVAARRQRGITGLFSAVSVVMAALAVFALFQSQRASAERDTAVFRQLLAQSSANLDTRPDLALLYAVEATRFRDSADARTALFTALDHSRYLDAVLQDGDANANFDGISNVAFSADGQTLLSADERGVGEKGETQVTLWDVSGKRPRLRFDIPHGIFAAALSPDGRLVATGDYKGPLELWDAATGARLADLTQGFVTFDDTHSLAFSPDGSLLASYDCDDAACSARHITLWNLATRTAGPQFRVEDGDLTISLAFSPNGSYLAAGACGDLLCSAHQVTLWDIHTGKVTFTYAAPSPADPGGINTFAFSGDSRTLVIGGCAAADCTTGRTVLLDMATGRRTGDPLLDPDGEINQLGLSPDGQTVVTVAGSGTLRLWNVAARTSTQLFGHGDSINDVSFTRDGRQFATGGNDNRVLLWRTAPFTPASPAIAGGFDSAAVFSPDGKSIATGNCQGQILLWDAATGARTLALGNPVQTGVLTCVGYLAFSPDGRRVAADLVANLLTWDVATRKALVFSDPTKLFIIVEGVMTFSPDGRSLVTSDFSGDLTVWDATAGTPIKQFPAPVSDGITSGAAFSRDGRLLALGASGNDVTLVDGHQFAPVSTLHGPRATGERIEQVAFTPDGRIVAGLSSTGVISLWEVKTHALLGSFQALQSNNIAAKVNTSLAFSPDGRMLAASFGQDFGLWDPATRAPIIAPQRDPATVRNLAFSPDGRLFLEAGVGATGGRVLVRYATPALWQAQACAIADRNFTPAEWRQVFDTDPYQKVCPTLPVPSSA